MNIVKSILFIIFISIITPLKSPGQSSLNNTKVDGYKGIWFELNQKYEYGDKYSGGLGTYTAKHIPLAIYSPKANKTFFVYGGTTGIMERHLLAMIGEYDHKTGLLSKPTVVYDKEGVIDPHDNPSILIDDEGFIWVFVSGRSTLRPGLKFKSRKPLNIDAFELISEEEFTYPQPWMTKYGILLLFTKYTGIRQLYFETSGDGIHWTDDRQLAAIPVNPGEKSGHYQISSCYDHNLVGTFFNRHIDGLPDKRTDLYYVQTKDFGRTWTNAEGKLLEIPLLKRESPARVIDYQSLKKNIYLKDMGYDADGHPVCLYIRSNGHIPGPVSVPYEWCITKWDGNKWNTYVVTESDHDYDMGSLYISGKKWKITGPTETGPQKWGAGGELAIWQSKNSGEKWKRKKVLTENSKFNHTYVRRPLNYKKPFCFFWADGNPHQFSRSELYFGDFKGHIWKLPYKMDKDFMKPVKIR